MNELPHYILALGSHVSSGLAFRFTSQSYVKGGLPENVPWGLKLLLFMHLEEMGRLGVMISLTVVV